MHKCAYIDLDRVVWDPAKAASNLRKHGIRFAAAVTVLQDELAITVWDEGPDEDRYVTMGEDLLGRVLVVVYCVREDRTRLVSARRATPSERRTYREGL